MLTTQLTHWHYLNVSSATTSLRATFQKRYIYTRSMLFCQPREEQGPRVDTRVCLARYRTRDADASNGARGHKFQSPYPIPEERRTCTRHEWHIPLAETSCLFWLLLVGLGTQIIMGNEGCLIGYAVVLWRFFKYRIESECTHFV